MTSTPHHFDIQVREEDLGEAGHVANSQYLQFATIARTGILVECGETTSGGASEQVHAIVLSDTISYRRETREATTLTVETTLSAARRDASRWEFSQRVLNGDEVAATVVALGGWLSSATHRLAVPPAEVADKLLGSPRAADFRWLD